MPSHGVLTLPEYVRVRMFDHIGSYSYRMSREELVNIWDKLKGHYPEGHIIPYNGIGEVEWEKLHLAAATRGHVLCFCRLNIKSRGLRKHLRENLRCRVIRTALHYQHKGWVDLGDFETPSLRGPGIPVADFLRAAGVPIQRDFSRWVKPNLPRFDEGATSTFYGPTWVVAVLDVVRRYNDGAAVLSPIVQAFVRLVAGDETPRAALQTFLKTQPSNDDVREFVRGLVVEYLIEERPCNT